jgi:hypothetical protein
MRSRDNCEYGFHNMPLALALDLGTTSIAAAAVSDAASGNGLRTDQV